MPNTYDLSGKTVLIAAGAKNLGGSISRRAAESGADVAIHYNSAATRSDAEETLEAVRASGRRGELFTGDLTVASNVAQLFTDVETAFGSIDVGINTVGRVLRKPIIETAEQEFDEVFDVNAKAAYFFIKEAGRHITDGGRIITIATSLLNAFTPGYSTYAGAKASVEDFTRAAAKEFADRGVSVNVIAPGPMDTPFFYAAETPERVAYLSSQAMGGRLTEIEDVVPWLLFLATDGGWLTGQTVFPNGGFNTR